jgi:hypothetical protein
MYRRSNSPSGTASYCAKFHAQTHRYAAFVAADGSIATDTSQRSSITINMMRRNGESWLISDIYLDGPISEVATRRSEFAAILKSDGIDGLIAALNRKADILTGTTAKSF